MKTKLYEVINKTHFYKLQSDLYICLYTHLLRNTSKLHKLVVFMVLTSWNERINTYLQVGNTNYNTRIHKSNNYEILDINL